MATGIFAAMDLNGISKSMIATNANILTICFCFMYFQF